MGNSFVHGRFDKVRNYNAAAVTDENYDLPKENPHSSHFGGEHGPHGGIPGIFKMLTDEAGLPFEVHVDAVSATTLGFQRDHALPLIAQAKWDAVVLQEYSTLSLPPARGGKPESFLTAATQLEQSVHAANPAARLYLYETFPRADLIYPEKAPYRGEAVDVMGADLHAGYERVFGADHHFAGVAWVGDAWIAAIRSGAARANPYATAAANDAGFDLWGTDHYHPSVYGAYLAALVLFREITQMPPTRLGPQEHAARDLGISPAEATRLQGFAEAVAQ